ncbi:hypothetical protein [Nocardiopsis coralliicola]
MSTTQKTRGAAPILADIRMIIALLFAIYGAVLTVLGFAPSADDIAAADGFNVNLWSGLGMLAFAAFMGGWALLKPVVPPESAGDGEGDAGTGPGAAPTESS